MPLTSSLSPDTQVPLGFSVAASVRVGNALGSGDVMQAKTSCITALLCTGQPKPLRRGIKDQYQHWVQFTSHRAGDTPPATPTHLFGQGETLALLLC